MPLNGVPVLGIGQPAAWFSMERDADEIVVSPRQPLPRRCTIRVSAQFEQRRRCGGAKLIEVGFPEACTVMGRLVFLNGATEPQRYRPFSIDPGRELKEVYFPVEAMPDDDWPASTDRWQNYQAIAKRLLAAAGVPWGGLSARDIDQLVTHTPYPEPLEGCVLHALTQWTHDNGRCVIEIGSFQGRSLTMLAMGLRGSKADSLLLSVDPHQEHPTNAEHVRLSLRQIGEESRLVQFPCVSAKAARSIAPASASLIFVDGDHAYERVVEDFENYHTLLAPGGCMLFHDHDFQDHNGKPALHPGVRRCIERYVLPSGEFKPLLLAHTLFAFQKSPDR